MVWLLRIAMIAFGLISATLGVLFLVRLAQSPSRREPEMRRMVLPVLLMALRHLGVGLGFVIFGLTLSWVAFASGCVLLVSEAPIRWITTRRANQIDPADDPAG